MKKLFTYVSIFFLFIIIGCSNSNKVHNIIPVKEPEILNLSVIDGKTTKQEILDILGTPDRFSDQSLSYSYRDDDKILRISITQKDGTKLDVTVGPSPKYKNHSVLFHMDLKNKNILNATSII